MAKKEYATYISTQGDKPFLDAAKGFFKNWGYPNVKDASNMNDVLTDLAKSKTNIEKFRIVSHANPASLEFGLMNDISPGGFSRSEAKMTNKDEFNSVVAFHEIMDNATYTKWTNLLLANADTKALLADMKITSVPPVKGESGIFLKALLESIFIDIALETGTDQPLTFANKGLMNSFYTARINGYKPILTQGMDAKALAAFNKAMAAFPGKASAFLITKNERPYFTADQANDIGNDLKNPKGAGLDPLINAAIKEGTGTGPFLKTLQKARDNISTATDVEIRGCNAGDLPGFLESFRSFFGAPGKEPTVTAPDLFEYFYTMPFATFTQHPANVKSLQDLWTLPDFGKNYNLSHRIRNRDLIVVVDADDNKLDQVIQRYALSLSGPEIKSLNPEITDFDKLSSGQQIWLKARRFTVDASTTKLTDFCNHYFGNAERADEIAKINGIKDPDKLTPGQVIEIVPGTLSTKTGYIGAELSQSDFEKNIRAGEAYMFMETNKQPRVVMDDSKRASALGKWLSDQNYGLNPETAADFEKKLSAKGGDDYMRKRFINFLSKSYPNIEDPILPSDPRYNGHIKKRP